MIARFMSFYKPGVTYGQPGNAPPPPHDPANAPNAPATAEWGLWPDNGQDNEDEVNGPVDAAEAANLVQVPIQGEPFLELNDLVNQRLCSRNIERKERTTRSCINVVLGFLI